MSKRFEWTDAQTAGTVYALPGRDVWDPTGPVADPAETGDEGITASGALVLGDPNATALVVEGSIDDLRALLVRGLAVLDTAAGRRTLAVCFDVTGLTERQVGALDFAATVQGEENDVEEEEDRYDSVPTLPSIVSPPFPAPVPASWDLLDGTAL